MRRRHGVRQVVVQVGSGRRPVACSRGKQSGRGSLRGESGGLEVPVVVLVTFEDDDVYNQQDAEGFIQLQALRLRLQAHRRK